LGSTVGGKRRPGRPRATNAAPPADTREAILDVAAPLFANKGYAATGTREIATMVGLRQASLFHYFARKEDLFAELLDRTVSPALTATAWLMQHPGRPEVRLYALAHHDVTNLCGSRHNLAALQLLPEARDPRFADFWAKRARLRGRYRSLIKDADRAGRVIDRPIEMVTDLVFGAVEATMTWSESSRRASVAHTADAVASAAVRGVLLKPPSPEALRVAANRLRREA
jgi:AcrR family transcriptional regulator